MGLENKLGRIEKDIQIGLKHKSADRLRNLINQHPNEQELWNKLAELYYESGFLDSAGRYWILTEPTDERIRKSVEIYQKSVNYSGYQILREITFRGDKSKLSEYGKRKLTALENDSYEKVKYVPKFAKINNQRKPNKNKNRKRALKDKLIEKLLLGLFMSIPIFAIIGFITVISLIF